MVSTPSVTVCSVPGSAGAASPSSAGAQAAGARADRVAMAITPRMRIDASVVRVDDDDRTLAAQRPGTARGRGSFSSRTARQPRDILIGTEGSTRESAVLQRTQDGGPVRRCLLYTSPSPRDRQ